MNVIAAANGAIHEILPKSALIDALERVTDALQGDVSKEMALQQFLLFLKDRTGIQAPRLFELLQSLRDDPEDAVRDALKDWDKLQAAINRLVALQGDQPWLFGSDDAGGVQFLTLADITDKTPVSLDIQYGEETTLGKGSFRFAVAGEAKSALSLQVLSAARAEEDLLIKPSPLTSNRIIVYSLSGDIGVQGKGGAPAPGGRLGVDAGATAGTKLRYIFEHPSNTKTIMAITGAYENLLNPFDLDAIAEKLAAPGVTGLRQLRFDGARSGWLNLDFNLARTVSTPTLVKTPSGKKTLQLNQALSAGIQLQYRAEASRMIVVERRTAGKIQLTSKHGRMQRNQFGLNLMAGIELVGLGGVAGSWAEYLLPEAGKLKDLLEEYAKPGDILMGKLTNELDGADDWVQSLGELLLGETDADSAARELSKDLNAKLSDLLDSAIDIFDFNRNNPTELVNRLTSKLTENNELLGIFSQEIATWLQAALPAGLTEFWEEFEGKVIGKADELATLVSETSKKTVAKQLAPLEDFGLKVSRVVDDLNTRGAELVGPIIKLLKQYGEQRRKLIEAVTESVQAKLAFKLNISRTVEERGGSEEVFQLISPPTGGYSERARSDYRKWLAGRLAAKSDFDGFGELLEGSINYGITGTTTTNVTLDLGPMTFGYASIIKAKADFKVALDGTILVGEAGFEGREWAKEFRGRSAESWFSGMLPVVDDAGKVSGEAFSLGHSYRNQKCDLDELDDYLESARLYTENGLFGTLPLRRKSLLIDAFEARDTRRAQVEISMVVSAQSLSFLIDNGFDRTVLATLLWNAYAAKYSSLMDWFYRAFYKKAGHEAELVLRLASELKGFNTQKWKRKKWVSDLGKSYKAKQSAGEVFKLIQAFHGIEIFFQRLTEYAQWRRGLSAPADADRNTLEKWIKEITREAFGMATEAAASLRWAVDPAGQAVASDEIPPDTLALFAYFDEMLGDDQVLAALNLETAPRDASTSWQLVPA